MDDRLESVVEKMDTAEGHLARIQAEADNTAVTLGERIVPSGQTSDRVGNAVVQIADIKRDIQNLEIRRNSALNSLSRDDFVENCLFMHLGLKYSWAKIAVDTGGINTPDNIRKMCNRHHW